MIWLLFIVHMCKMIISPGVFSIIENFDFYGCQGEGNGRVKKNQKIKNPVCRALYFRNHISWFSFMVHMCRRIISPGISVFQNFDFQEKGKKWLKMTRKSIWLTLYLSAENYVHKLTSFHRDFQNKIFVTINQITIFGTHEEIDDISSRFFFFSKFWVYGFLGELKGYL